MIEERAKELVAALRSGKYQQTQRKLRTKDGFCCLGVACDIAPPSTGRWVFDDNAWTFALEDGTLPKSVQEYFGFRSNNGFVKGSSTALVEMNDTGQTFAQIADFIEQNWRNL